MNNNEVNYRDNAFDLLKMVAAFIVLLSHSFRHFEVTKPPFTLFFTDGSTGVITFFAITGFVIMASWDRMQNKDNSYLKFLFNRCVRLYPPVIISFCIITLLNNIIYKFNITSKEYIIYSLKYCIFFRGGGYSDIGISNGVLWSILPIIVYYVLTPVIYKLKNLSIWGWIFVIGIFWLFNVWDAELITMCKQIPYIGRFVDAGFPLCFLYEFMIGSFLYFKRNTIILFFCIHKHVVCVYLVLFTTFFELYTYFDLIPKTGEMHSPWIGILLSPLVVILGFIIGKIVIKCEMSYSIFLYHMVVIAVLKHLGFTGVTGIMLTAFVTPIMAYFSRKIVEEPMLKFKL